VRRLTAGLFSSTSTAEKMNIVLSNQLLAAPVTVRRKNLRVYNRIDDSKCT